MDPHQNVWNMWEGTTQFPASPASWPGMPSASGLPPPDHRTQWYKSAMFSRRPSAPCCRVSPQCDQFSVHGHFPLGHDLLPMAGSLYPSSSRNLSVVVQRPPCLTKASIPDSNRAPSFSLWAHSVRWATSRHSWTGLDDDMVSMLYALHIVNLCMSLHIPGVQS